MGFWSSLAKDFATELAADYLREKGAKGAMEDLGNLVNGVKNYVTANNDSANTGNALYDGYSELMEQGAYEEAIDFINQCYEGTGTDYLYYYYIGYAQFELGRSKNDLSMVSTGVQNMKTSYNSCPVATEDSEFLKSRYNEALEIKNFLTDRKDTMDYIDLCCKNGNYSKAIDKWDKFNRKHFNDNKDFAYYDEIAQILFMELMDTNAADMDFQSIDEILSKMNTVITNEEERNSLQGSKDFLYSLKFDKRVAQYKNDGAYDKAIAEIEEYYSTQSDKFQDQSYWTGLFKSYYGAVHSGMIIGKSKKEDLTALRHALSQIERLDDGKQAEYIAEYRAEIEDLMANIPSSEPTYVTDNQDNIPSKIEEEYIVELKECYSDGVITDRERRLLDKLRKTLGISEERARELEVICNPATFTKEEEEYAEEIREAYTDGIITDKERRLLNKLAKSLNISEQRAAEIERIILDEKKLPEDGGNKSENN